MYLSVSDNEEEKRIEFVVSVGDKVSASYIPYRYFNRPWLVTACLQGLAKVINCPQKSYYWISKLPQALVTSGGSTIRTS